MRVSRFALMASVAARSVGAFAPSTVMRSVAAAARTATPTPTTACFSTKDETSICDVPNEINSVQLKDQPRGGKILRDLDLTAADGSIVNLGSKMGDGTSMVVFLRHLG